MSDKIFLDNDGNVHLSVYPQMVEYQTARLIFARLGMALHRKNDSTMLVKFEGNGNNWFNGKKYDLAIGVDQGCFSDVAVRGQPLGFAIMAQELIPWEGFLLVLKGKFAPDAKIKPPTCLGHKRAARELASQYFDALKEVELPEWLLIGKEEPA